ncbi:MAG: NnrS family protein [Variibacter sp.]|nr:NnrS family protein [Variibacter sp.]
MTVAAPPSAIAARRPALLSVLSDEGFRLFFPLAALQLSLWPLLWTLVHRLDLPFAYRVPSGLWHAHEMLIGGFGAAVLGFITTAVPEWTDTDRMKGRPLLALAAVWAGPRLIGLVGADALIPIAGALDVIWLAALCGYVLRVSWKKRTTRLLAFAGWIAAIGLAEMVMRFALATGEFALAQRFGHVIALLFTGLLGLALARIAPPVTNLVLDPSERTSPFRPHPGRLNIAPGLTALAVAAEVAGLPQTVVPYLWIAAGAAFMDRVAEAFIGRCAFRTEILGLAGASALAGTGLLLVGAARLGAPIAETPALHVLLMGGVSTGVLSVFSIAGRLHTGQPLGLTRKTKLAFLLLIAGTLLRVAPDFGLFALPGPVHGLASAVWASAFLLWLRDYWPALSDPATLAARSC